MTPQLLRLEGRTVLEEALRRIFDERRISSGFFRATGVLREVELRSYDGREGAPGPLRKLPGTWLCVSLEGTLGTFQGDLSFGLRAVLSREGELGMEMAAGEIVTAQSLGLEGVVWASESVIVRSRDDVAGVWMIEGSPAGTALTGPAKYTDPVRPRAYAGGESPELRGPDAARTKLPSPRASTPPTEPAAKALGGGERRKAPPTLASADWGAVAEASAEQDPNLSTYAPPPLAKTAVERRADLLKPMRAPIGQPPLEPGLIPARGDIAEHFAFGRCEVVKTEGDRIHLKLERDGRIKEIALEMLRVKEVDSATPGRRRFKLERKI